MRRWRISPDMPRACPYITKTITLMLPQRKHIRLRDFDYSSANAYFITICVNYFECLLGKIKNGIRGLSDIGAEAAVRLQKIPEWYADVILDEFIIMPNHLHVLLIIDRHNGPYQSNAFSKPVAESISMHINHFKGAIKNGATTTVGPNLTGKPNFTITLFGTNRNTGSSKTTLSTTRKIGRMTGFIRTDIRQPADVRRNAPTAHPSDSQVKHQSNKILNGTVHH